MFKVFGKRLAQDTSKKWFDLPPVWSHRRQSRLTDLGKTGEHWNRRQVCVGEGDTDQGREEEGDGNPQMSFRSKVIKGRES